MQATDFGRFSRGPLRLGLAISLSGMGMLPAMAGDAGLPALQSDFGGVGLMQTPTARMADVGQFAANYHVIDPYSMISVSLQPLDWLEFGFRYTSIENRSFNASDRDYLDKGVNLKLRLIEEGQYMPAVALGFRDLGGTGFFSSEYLVASKRWRNFDFSLGVASGYLGAGGSISNPLGFVDDHFDVRRRNSGGSQGGEFGFKQMFTGDIGFFGGVAYQTPWDPLILQVEYDGNDYQSEPKNNDQDQDWPVNIGARLQVTDNFVLSAGWERGNTAMFGATYQINLAEFTQPKSDPAPVPTQPAPQQTTEDWSTVSRQLAANAGIDVSRVLRQDDALVIEGVATKYRSLPETELRANRILHNVVSDDIKKFKYRWAKGGLLLREDALPRDPLPQEVFVAQQHNSLVDQDYRNDVYVQGMSANKAAADGGLVLYQDPWRGYDFSISPGLQVNYGGPDGFLYQTVLQLSGRVWTDANGFLSGTLGYILFGNFEDYQYLAPSGLPRVRSYIGEYLQQTDLGVFNLQYTRTARLGENWFAMGYLGYLEMMYGGVGGEVLYRPFNSPLAMGLDVNWVRQREFDTGFEFRDYETVTGHLTTYWETGFKDILAKVSVGRYLAQDWGLTLDLSRRFASGVRISTLR